MGLTVPRVLYVVHRLPPGEYTGTPLVTHGYATHVGAHSWDASVLYASAGVRSWDEAEPVRGRSEPFTRVAVPPTPHASWEVDSASLPAGPDDTYRREFRRLLARLAPDVVHVVDNVLLPLELPELASAAGVPVVRTVSCAEDLCGLITPVSAHSGPAGYCEAPITPSHCAACITAERPGIWGNAAADAPGPAPSAPDPTPSAPDPAPSAPSSRSNGDLLAEGERGRLAAALFDARRRRLLQRLERKRERARSQFAATFDRIVFSTTAFREYFEQTLPLDPRKVRVVAMGMDRSPWPRTPPPHPPRKGPVVMCLAGVLSPAKGYAVLVDAFGDVALAGRDDYRLHLLGGGDLGLVAPLLSKNANVLALGSYRADELPRLLAGGDVGLSISPFETFHRVTREYLLAGLPVIANPTFGIGDLIRDGYNGLVYDQADPKSLTDAVVAFLDDPGLRERLAAGAAATPVRSIGEEVGELVALYEEVLADRG